MPKEERYTVIFLTDRLPINRLVVLKRAAFKSFAPNRYTGIGGKVESGETLLEGALRELKEETGLVGIELTEFARCRVNSVLLLSYFCGLLNQQALPPCNEGNLSWVKTDLLRTHDIIPNTKLVLEEWRRRAFATDQSWTLSLNRAGNNTDATALSSQVNEGLLELLPHQ